MVDATKSLFEIQKPILLVLFVMAALSPNIIVPMTTDAKMCENDAWNVGLRTDPVQNPDFLDTDLFRHNLRDDCPMIYDSGSGQQNPQDLALCPWTTETHHDFHRYPHNMTYARCACKNCVTWDDSGHRHECKAHYHSFQVIRRSCQPNGKYRYFYTEERLPIACVCSREAHTVTTG